MDNLLPHLAEDGRVVIFGAKLSQNPFVRMLNSLLAKAFSRATFASTPALEYEPWTLLERGLGKFHAQEYFFGIFFLAGGPLPVDDSRPQRTASILW